MNLGASENKTLQEQLDGELFLRANASAAGSVLLYLILVVSLKLYQVTNILPLIAGGLIVISNLERLRVSRGYAHFNSNQKVKWKRWYSIWVMGSAVGFALLCSWVFSVYGFNDPNSSIALLLLSGVASSALISLGAAPKLFKAYAGVSLLTPIVSECLLVGETHQTYLVLFLIFFAYLTLQSKIYFSSLKNRFLNGIQIEKDRALLQTILDTVPGYISYINEKMEYLAMNRNLRLHLGLEESEVIGKSVGFLNVQQDSWAEEIRQFKDSHELGLNREIQLSVNGEKKWHLLSLRKSEDTNWIVCVSIDINDEKLLEIEAAEQKVRSETSAKMASLGEMSSGIAHEINNPLAIIKGKAQSIRRMIQKELMDPEQMTKSLDSIDKTVDRIAKIIQGLRAFARDGSQDAFQPQTVRSIVEDTLSLCQNRFSNKGIELRIQEIKADLVIECRATEIAQVLLNLLGNAFDAIETLSEKWVSVSAYDVGDWIEIRVTDSGHGIPLELHEKVLQPFFTTKEVGKGTGLGLSISSGIVKAHHGAIEIDSSGPNTTFVVRLPKKQTPQIPA